MYAEYTVPHSLTVIQDCLHMPSVFLMKLIDARVTTGNPATRPCTLSTSVPRTRHPCRDYNAYSVVWLMYSSTPHHCDIPGNGRMYAEYAVPTLAMYSVLHDGLHIRHTSARLWVGQCFGACSITNTVWSADVSAHYGLCGC